MWLLIVWWLLGAALWVSSRLDIVRVIKTSGFDLARAGPHDSHRTCSLEDQVVLSHVCALDATGTNTVTESGVG